MVNIIKDDSMVYGTDNRHKFWWNQKKLKGLGGSIHGGVSAFLKAHERFNNGISLANLRYIRMYGNSDYMGLKIGNYNNLRSKTRLTLNVVRSGVDTLTSKITKNRPKPSFLTEGGEWRTQQKAKKLEKFAQGAFYQCGLYDLGQHIFKDAAVFGKGIWHPYWEETPKGPVLRSERVFPEELKIDENEAIYENPRQIHRLKYMAKEVLAANYPDHATAIRNAPKPKHLYLVDQTLNEMVEVRESWHLPSTADATDGLHSITIDGADLFVEPYCDDYFPFIWFSYQKKLLGLWFGGFLGGSFSFLSRQYGLRKSCRYH